MEKTFQEIEIYAAEVEKLKGREANLTKRAQLLYKISNFLSTRESTPEISFSSFLVEDYPDYEKLLPSEVLQQIRKYESEPTNETIKSELIRTIGTYSKGFLQARSKTQMLLAECPEEIQKKKAECEAKKKAFLEQIQILSEKIGEITAEEIMWEKIMKEVNTY